MVVTRVLLAADKVIFYSGKGSNDREISAADGFPQGATGNLQCPQVTALFGCHLAFILDTKCAERSRGQSDNNLTHADGLLSGTVCRSL